MLLTLTELEKSSDDTYLKLKEDFFVFPEGNNSSKKLELRMKFKQRIDDIIMTHRYVIAVYNNNRKEYNLVYKKFNENHLNMFEEISEENKHMARMAFPNYNWKEEIEQVKTIANESLIINLWATIEQFTNRTLKLINTDSNSSHHWNRIIEEFNNSNVDILSINSYENINELRVVNNKIKHLYFVDEQLAEFENFNGMEGKSLNLVSFNLQEYISSSYHFIFTLINSTGETTYYPE